MRQSANKTTAKAFNTSSESLVHKEERSSSCQTKHTSNLAPAKPPTPPDSMKVPSECSSEWRRQQERLQLCVHPPLNLLKLFDGCKEMRNAQKHRANAVSDEVQEPSFGKNSNNPFARALAPASASRALTPPVFNQSLSETKQSTSMIASPWRLDQ
jgi:hypothetical protein